MRKRRLKQLAAIELACALTLIACVGSSPEAIMQAEYDQRIQWSGTTSAVCELISIGEVTRILGTPVVDSRMMARDSGRCQWLSRSTAHASLRLDDARHAHLPGDESTRERLEGFAAEAFVTPVQGDYRAQARTATHVIDAVAHDRDSALAILHLTWRRMGH